jgi:hypothetical protein
MNTIETLAAILLEQLGVTGKPDLSSILTRLGLRVKEVNSTGFDGVLVRAQEGSKGIIGVKKSIRENTRKRFTIAHEIGHYIIPRHKASIGPCAGEAIESWSGDINPLEVEANEFASAFLLPKDLVRVPLRLHELSMSSIRNVANLFETSLTATGYRFLSLTDLSCALVWSGSGNARWYQGSLGFPFFLPKNELPHPGSFAGKLFGGGSVPDDFSPVPPDLWLSNKDAEKVKLLLEHSIYLHNYDAVLTWLWISEFHDEIIRIEDREDAYLDDLDPEDFSLHRKKWPR